MDDATSRPGEQSGHDEPHALARPCRCETENMFGAVMPQIVASEPAQHDPFAPEHPGSTNLAPARPSRRTIGLGLLPFAGAPYRHGNRDDDGGEPARRCNQRPLVEDRRRIGVEGEPPPEEGRRRIDGIIAKAEPGFAEFGLEGERRRRPLRRAPDRQEDDQKHGRNLAPENPVVHARLP